MKINRKKILIKLEKVRIFFKKLFIFLEFIVEEIPSIFSILIIPTSLGLLLLIPKATIYVGVITSLTIELYILVKSDKKFPKYHNKLGWQIALLLASLFFGLVVAFITALAKTNLEFSFK